MKNEGLKIKDDVVPSEHQPSDRRYRGASIWDLPEE
jgi:hypothetical protein